MIKFPKIVQYRQIIRSLKLQQQYAGKDENDRPIYDSTKNLTPVKFRGREKLHGTQAAIGIDFKKNKWWAQSRERVLSEEEDNAGFYKFAKGVVDSLGKELLGVYNDDIFEFVVFGEFCGGSIQKGVALNELEKMFVIFACKAKIGDEWFWLDSDKIPEIPDLKIYNISRGPLWEIEVDLNHPERALADITKWTLEVEEESPFCKSLGVSGIGEGIVFSVGNDFDQSFKSKGEKHSKSKVKKLPTVDIEKLNGVDSFIQKHVNEDRLQQGFDIVCHSEELKDMKSLGEFIRWVNNDVWTEEGDEAEENDIERKLFGSRMSPICVKWFKEKINQF